MTGPSVEGPVDRPDIVGFLRARLAEDEAAAKAVSEAGWHLHGPRPDGPNAVATLLARHDPARVLREVEAKRRIVELHGRRLVEGRDGDGMEREGWFCRTCWGADRYPCPTLRQIAAVFQDHPDYDPAWRPS